METRGFKSRKQQLRHGKGGKPKSNKVKGMGPPPPPFRWDNRKAA